MRISDWCSDVCSADRFLIFVVLAARKGILRLLDALLLLPPEIAARTAVVIAGKVAAEIAEDVSRRIAEVSRKRPDLWLHTKNRHLSSGQIDAQIGRAHVRTPVTNAQLVCRLLPQNKTTIATNIIADTSMLLTPA